MYWLDLPSHLADTAGVAELVWQHLIPPQQKRALVNITGWSKDQLRELYVYLAGAHDVGKASTRWAYSRLERLGSNAHRIAEGMSGAGLTAPRVAPRSGDEQAEHDLVGWAWLVKEAAGEDVERMWAAHAPVMSHHGKTVQTPVSRRMHSVLRGNDRWAQARREALPVARPVWLDQVPPLHPAAQVLLAGMVTLADWVASSERLFPLVPVGEHLEWSRARVDRGWKDLAAPGPWSPEVLTDADQATNDRFAPKDAPAPWSARPIQAEAVDLAKRIEPSSLVIIEDRMGQGKTEAALLTAETLGARSGARGVLMALPTMATADTMMRRARAWSSRVPGHRLTSSLSHSRAHLNAEVSPERDDAWWWTGQGPAVAQLFDGLVVTTIDKVLQMALMTNRVMVNHAAITSKVVILDEIHSADPYMLMYLKTALRWLGTYGVPVVALSATLTQKVRNELLSAYTGNQVSSPDGGYPRITHISGGAQPEVVLPPQPSASTHVLLRHLDERSPGALSELLRGRLRGGGVAAVVCNTVARAQHTFDQLKGSLGSDTEVVLHHSRYVSARRAETDSRLASILGDGGNRPHRMVVVATQVIEQSLDIDFDLMVTDPAPMDLILQRIGRLHRHRRSRPAKLSDPTCYLRGYNPADGEPWKSTGSKQIYGLAAVRRALAVLTARGHLRGKPLSLPADIPVLVQDAYADAPSVPNRKWAELIAADDAADAESEAAREQEASYFLVPQPSGDSALYDSAWERPKKDAAKEERRPTVRDGDSGPEVLLIDGSNGWRVPDIHGLPLAGTVLNPDMPLEEDVAMALARGMVLRTPPSVPFSAAQNVPSAWDQGPMRGKLLLVMGEGLKKTIPGHRPGKNVHLEYTSDHGLMVRNA